VLENRRVDPRDPDTVEWGDQVSEVKPCVEFTELPGRFGIRTSQFFNNADVDVFLDISSTELTRITSTDPEEMPAAGEFYADGGSGYIFVHSSHLGADIRADYYPGGGILTAEVLDSEEFQGPEGPEGPEGPTGPAGGVDTVFGRPGPDITAQTSDYTQDQVTDGTTNKQFSATEKTKLAGIESAADVTDADNVLAALPAGSVIQSVYTKSGAADSTNLGISYDDTIPQDSEGKNFAALDTTITVTNAASKIRVQVILNISDNSASGAIRAMSALFLDGAAGAIDAKTTCSDDGGQSAWQHIYDFEYVAGSTGSKTFKIRFGDGNGGSGNTYINDANANATLGGVQYSSMRVSEIKA